MIREIGPPELHPYDQWVVTKLTPRPGAPNNKPPYVQNGHGQLRLASGPVDQRHHMPYTLAHRLVRDGVDGMQWLGFTLLPTDPFCGIDLDNCRHGGDLGFCRPKRGSTLGFYAPAVLAHFRTYASISPSGTGVRLWLQGQVPDGALREGGHGKWTHINCEAYSQGQYLTETGRRLQGPSHAMERQEALSLFCHAADALNQAQSPASRVARLVRSLWQAPGDSESDLRLANALATHIQDPAVLETLLRFSGAYREKWDSPRGSGTWLSEFVVRTALDRPLQVSTEGMEPAGDLVEKRLAYLTADAEARRRLAASNLPPLPGPLLEAGSWMDADIPDPTWLVPSLWVEGMNILLAAEYKAGKTTLVVNTVRSLLGGGSLLGQDAAPPSGSIVLVNAEMPPAQLRLWIREAIPRPLLGRLFILNVVGSIFDLGVGSTREWLASELKRVGASVVVLDTFSALFFGEENSNSEVMSFLRGLDSMKAAAGCSNLMLVHHLGRKSHEEGKEHGRGASVLDGWAGARWILVRDGDSRWLSAQGRDVQVEDWELEYDEVTRLLSRAPNGRSRRQAREDRGEERLERLVHSVASWVRAHPGCSVQELRAGLGGRQVDVSRALARALDTQRVVDRAVHGEGPQVARQLHAGESAVRPVPASPSAVRTGEPVARPPRQSPVKGTGGPGTGGGGLPGKVKRR